jgi:hypothetical protein
MIGWYFRAAHSVRATPATQGRLQTGVLRSRKSSTSYFPYFREHAMKSFLSRFGSFVLFVLSGFDRLRFVGESRLLNHGRGVQSYLYQQQILFKNFPEHAQQLTQTLRRQTEALAHEQDVPLLPLNSSATDKEATALQLAQRQPQRCGRIAVLSCVESCSTYRLRKNGHGHIEPRKEVAKCLHYYHYFQHPRLGLCYVRIQSWFPFSVRVGLNGRAWLAQQLHQRGCAYQRLGNLLWRVQDAALAQALLDEQTRTDWPALLQALVAPVHPLWTYLHSQVRAPYYWMTEQSEWATDIVFHSPDLLAQWYPRWLRHGILTLSCRDALQYLGKYVPPASYGRCRDEAKIEVRARPQGTRLKFWYGSNSLKMYDKEAPLAGTLRLETTINDPKGYRVFRTKEGDSEEAAKSWQQLRKGVADLARRAEVSQAANQRLAESLASVAETTPLGKLLEPLSKPVWDGQGRRHRALNPSAGADGELLRCVAHGEFLVNGFRNRDLRKLLCPATTERRVQRQQAAAMTRKLALLRAHGLIVKVQKTHRYRLSAEGQRVIAALVAAYEADVSRLSSAG